MQHLSNADVRMLLTRSQVQQEMQRAFEALASGGAALQARRRTSLGEVKLSVMEAILGYRRIAGAKIYTTIEGRFKFVILLFCMDSGLPLAVIDADEVTRLRTAATTLLAARHLARGDSKILSVLGAGVQGIEHAVQLGDAFDVDQILIADLYVTERNRQSIDEHIRRPVMFCSKEEALGRADILISASRSPAPLMQATDLAPGCFIAAIGATLPTTRELDDTVLASASTIAVEWESQSMVEAGDMLAVDGDPSLISKVVPLAALVSGQHPGRTNKKELTIFKSVGIALEDIAIAALAYEVYRSRRPENVKFD